MAGSSRPIHRELALRAVRIGLGKLRRRVSLSADQRLELRGGQGGAEVKSLVLIAAEGLQEIELLGGFDAFRHHLQPQAMRQRNDGTHDGSVVGPGHDLADEASIDLEFVDGKSP